MACFFFFIFHSLSFELNLFFDRTCPLKAAELEAVKDSFKR